MNKQMRRRIAIGVLSLAASFGVGATGASAATPASQAQVTNSSVRHLGQNEVSNLGHFRGPLGHFRGPLGHFHGPLVHFR
jgi:hypothetical protein